MKPLHFVINDQLQEVDGVIAPLVALLCDHDLYDPPDEVAYEPGRAVISFEDDPDADPWPLAWLRNSRYDGPLRVDVTSLLVRDHDGTLSQRCSIIITADHDDEIEFALAVSDLTDDLNAVMAEIVSEELMEISDAFKDAMENVSVDAAGAAERLKRAFLQEPQRRYYESTPSSPSTREKPITVFTTLTNDTVEEDRNQWRDAALGAWHRVRPVEF